MWNYRYFRGGDRESTDVDDSDDASFLSLRHVGGIEFASSLTSLSLSLSLSLSFVGKCEGRRTTTRLALTFTSCCFDDGTPEKRRRDSDRERERERVVRKLILTIRFEYHEKRALLLLSSCFSRRRWSKRRLTAVFRIDFL